MKQARNRNMCQERRQRAAGTKRPTRRWVDERGLIGLKGRAPRELLLFWSEGIKKREGERKDERRERRERQRELKWSRDKEVKRKSEPKWKYVFALLVPCFYWEPKENEREMRGEGKREKERGRARERSVQMDSVRRKEMRAPCQRRSTLGQGT